MYVYVDISAVYVYVCVLYTCVRTSGFCFLKVSFSHERKCGDVMSSDRMTRFGESGFRVKVYRVQCQACFAGGKGHKKGNIHMHGPWLCGFLHAVEVWDPEEMKWLRSGFVLTDRATCRSYFELGGLRRCTHELSMHMLCTYVVLQT